MKNNIIFLFIIGLMCAIGLIATDIYIPVLPQIGNYFETSQHSLQLTLSVYLFGLAISQLIYGPLSDRYGRRPIILMGMVIFVIGTFLCMLSVSINMFIASRLLQAIGASSGMVIGRAVVGDTYTKQESAKIFTVIFPIVGLSPAISPVIGGLIGSIANWRIVFAFVVLLSSILFLMIILFLHETKSRENRVSIHPKIIFGYYKELFFCKNFWAYTSIVCFAYITYFGYIAESPFLFHHFKYTAIEISFFYVSLSLSYLFGNQVAKRLLSFMCIDRTIFIGYGFFGLGGIMFIVLNHGVSFTPVDLILPATILTFGNGFLLPLGTAGLVSSFEKISGYASGLMGTMQLSSAALSVYLVGILSKTNITAFTIYMLLATFTGFSLFLFLVPVFSKFKKVA
ncbi:transport protein [Francisella sp. W12-1067]|nr:transport protein [Francisella sp. W12-1067]